MEKPILVPALVKVEFTPQTYLERRLPVAGELRVGVGEEVEPFTVVGEALEGWREERIPEEMDKYLLKRVGEGFAAGEVVARKRGFFGWGGKIYRAPFAGILGEAVLRTVPRKVILTAGAPGRVVKVAPRRAVLLKIAAIQVHGVWAGGETGEGELTEGAAADEIWRLSKVTGEMKGRIVFGGSFAPAEVLRKAAAIGISGLVCGGAPVLPDDFFAGMRFALLVTEGFGPVPMTESTWQFLRSVSTRMVIIAPDRHTLLVPERGLLREAADLPLLYPLRAGERVQVFSWPYFGRVGKAVSFGEEKIFPSGVKGAVVKVDLPGEKEPVEVPLRNVGVVV